MKEETRPPNIPRGIVPPQPHLSLRDEISMRATEADIKSVIGRDIRASWDDREGAKYIYADRMLKAREQ